MTNTLVFAGQGAAVRLVSKTGTTPKVTVLTGKPTQSHGNAQAA